MNKPTYRNSEGLLLTINQAAAKYNLGLATIRRLAKECGAELKIGNCYRINDKKMGEYILSCFEVRSD